MSRIYLKKSKRSKWGCISDNGELCFFAENTPEGHYNCKTKKHNCGGKEGCVFIRIPSKNANDYKRSAE